jgi:hypothetical protein
LYGRVRGHKNFDRAMFRNTFSKGKPSRSYMAKKKQGSMRTIIKSIAIMFPMAERVKRYVGMPITAAIPKQINCLFVRLKAIFDFILLRSLGTLT